MKFASLLAGLVIAVPVSGQTTPPDVAQHEPQPDAASQLDFATEDLRMTVPVTIGSAGPYRFIVDTGSERTVISAELAGLLKLAPGKRVRVTAMAGPMMVETFVIPNLTVGSAASGARLTGGPIEAPALLARNLGAAGLVGVDTLQGRAVTIDFAQQAMTVVPATRRLRKETFGSDDIVVRAKNVFGQLVVTNASYRGHKVRVILDTGTAVSMGNLALRRLVAADIGALQPITVTSVTGAVLQTDYTQVTRITVGDIGFAHLPVAFSDAAPFARLGLGDRPALFLGMDALRLFGRVRIDFANREVRLARPLGKPAP